MDFNFLIQTYLFLATTFIVVYFIGHILYSFLDQNKKAHRAVFYKLILGIIILPSSYAIINSNGKTILMGGLLIILSIIIMLIIQKNISFRFFKQNFFKIEIKELLFVFIATSVFFTLQLNSLFELGSGSIKVINKDYSFYARLAGYLRDFGVENVNVEYFLSEKGGLSPYHYTELWFTGLVSKVFKLHVQYALMLITYPIILSLVYTGWIYIIKFLRSYFKSSITWYDYFIPVFFFTFSMFGEIYPSNIEILKMDIWTPTILSMLKLSIIYPFIMLIILKLYEKQYLQTSITASLLAPVYTTVSVSVFFAWGVFYLINLVFKKESLKKTLVFIAPIAGTSLFIIGFYYFYGESGPISLSLNDLINTYSSIEGVKVFFNIIIKSFIQIIITTSPFLILFLFNRKFYSQNMKIVLSFSFVLILVSILMWAITHMMHDSVQLWTNIYIPLINTLVFFLLITFLINSAVKMTYKFLALGLLLICIYLNNPLKGDSKIIQIESSYNSIFFDPNSRFAFIKEGEDYLGLFDKLEQTYAGDVQSLMRIIDPLYIVCLSPNEIPVSNINEQKFINWMTFSRYKKLYSNDSISENKLQLKFIEEFNINYLLVNKHRPVPEHLSELFDSISCGLIDDYSIYALKKN